MSKQALSSKKSCKMVNIFKNFTDCIPSFEIDPAFDQAMKWTEEETKFICLDGSMPSQKQGGIFPRN